VTTFRHLCGSITAPTMRPCCYIAPPHVLAVLAEEGSPEQREAAINALAASASMRGRRSVLTALVQAEVDVQALAAVPPSQAKITVYDVAQGGQAALPGTKVRGDGDPPSADDAVNEAYDGAETTYKFYEGVYGRNSVDDKGLELVSSVHYSVAFDNAFWNGTQMVYGDGSGRIFAVGGLTRAIDVIGHELTHGVTQYTAGLEYHTQSGAVNEHCSDVFGSLVKQHSLGQTADQADWLIGEGILVPGLGEALRSMKAPGTAWRYDTQPGTMSGYQNLPDDTDPRNDNGGVHINSGIPNHAFYLAATAIGGNAWEKAGKIWYDTLTTRLTATSDFRDLAEKTIACAEDLFGAGAETAAVQSAWHSVGVLP